MGKHKNEDWDKFLGFDGKKIGKYTNENWVKI